MYEFPIPDGVNPEAIARRIIYLAWKASRCQGMGFHQDRGDMTEMELFNRTGEHVQPPEKDTWQQKQWGEPVLRYSTDYVFGRMMKLNVYVGTTKLGMTSDFRIDYQSFAGKYKTAQELAEAAIASMK